VLLFDGVKHHANHVLPLQLLPRPLSKLGRCFSSAHNQKNPVAKVSKHGRICHRQARRRIKHDPVEDGRDAVEQDFERAGLGKAFHYKTPAAVFEEIRKAVPGYNVDTTPLLTGSAEPTHVHVARNGHAPYDVPAGLIRSAHDTLFTTGTLTRFCTMMESLQEDEAKS